MTGPRRRLGQPVSYLETDPNGFTWDFRAVSGLEFEAEIQRIVRHELKPDGESVWVVDTPRTGDRGKDIVVHFTKSITLLGLRFNVPRNDNLASLYIECKKINSHTLSANDFGGSFLQLNAEGRTPQFFLLVSNAALSPETLHNSKERFRHCGCKFQLLDKRRLALALQGRSTNLPPHGDWESEPTVTAMYSAFDRDSMQCLLSGPDDTEGARGRRKVIEAFIALDNYTHEVKSVRLSLRSDINWRIKALSNDVSNAGDDLDFFIPAFEARTVRLRLEQASFEALDELRLGLNIDGRSRTVEIRGRNIEFDFIPPLFGAGHLGLLDRLHEAVGGPNPPGFISLQGDAGTGKSKLLEELAGRLEGTDRHFCRIELRTGREMSGMALIIEEICQVNGLEPPPERPSFAQFFQFLRQIPDHYAHYVVCFEDLHHASAILLTGLREYIHNPAAHVTLIGTGRADGTFPNDQYFALLDHVAILATGVDDSSRVLNLALDHWSDADCRSFIKMTVAEAPQLLVDRIHILSENTPFGVIQSIEYLLDVDIVRVVNRNTVGVTNAEWIGAKCDLPAELSELIAMRCNHLVMLSGRRARILLIAIAVLGMQVKASLARLLASSQEDYDALVAAEKLKFVAVNDDAVRINHENFQAFFLSQFEHHPDGIEAARCLLRHEAVLSNLNEFQIGNLHAVAGNNAAAFELFRDLWEAGTASENISSIDISAEKLSFFRPLINVSLALGKDSIAVAHLCVVETYSALHNAPLAIALLTAQRQYIIINQLRLADHNKEDVILEIRQLEAHILLNLGYVLSAQKIMLEISAKAALSDRISRNSRLMFDVFDRLQNIYHQLNHWRQFVQYSDLSGNVATVVGDKKLAALVQSSRAKEYLYDDPDEFLRLTENATSWSRRHASRRHICHAELNLCIAKLIAAPQDKTFVSRQIPTLSDLLSEATQNAYSFSITRAELALGSAYALLGLDQEENRLAATRYARIGIDSCLRFGTGFFVWQLHNLLAILELQERDASLERAAGHWQTALHYLERQGLLFLGNLDSCSPNLAVITNLILFMDENQSDGAVKALIEKLNTYDGGRMEPDAQYRHWLKSVREYGLLGRSTPLPRPLRVPNTKYLLALR